MIMNETHLGDYYLLILAQVQQVAVDHADEERRCTSQSVEVIVLDILLEVQYASEKVIRIVISNQASDYSNTIKGKYSE